MKIDRSNPAHWAYLVGFGLCVAVALVLRPFWRRRGTRRVVLYGHKLGGNLLALDRLARDSPALGIETVFLTMDPAYHRELRAQGESTCLAMSAACIRLLASADAIVSDHGLHVLQAMLGRSSLRFFDVWHGIPFKGFDADDFRVQHRYDEVWVASPLLRGLYADRFGFDPQRLEVTGYARTDRLVRGAGDADRLRQRLGLPADAGRLVLFAPTWVQDTPGRSLYPFGLAEDEFLGALSQLGRRTGATILVRAHLNSSDAAAAGGERVVPVPYARFPDTEGILLACDVLVCDWSSIAFDYLLLDRPTIFLDVPPPFAKGFSLGPEYRYGAVVTDLAALLSRLEQALDDPAAYHREFGARHAEVRARVYGDHADGEAARRCLARLEHWLPRGGSSR